MSEATLDIEALRRAAFQQAESLYRFGVRQIPQSLAAAVAPLATPGAQGASATPATPKVRAPEPERTPAPTFAPAPISMSRPAAKPVPAPMPPTENRPAISPATPWPEVSRSLDERQSALEIVRTEVAGCTRCAELASTRTQTVFGVGNVSPRICFFGEAPGADEDKQGEPFVGRAGKLLNDIIKACKFEREDVYILNVLKCRPPNNRPPLPDEAANCRHFWERQLEILRPEYVVCLGASAAQTMLQSGLSIGRLRGKFHEYRGSKVIATYHPAYLLRNPDAKRDVWEDMKMMMRDMGLAVP